MPGQPGYKDVITATGQGAGNVDKAKKILTDAGYTIVGRQAHDQGGRDRAAAALRYTKGNALREADR